MNEVAGLITAAGSSRRMGSLKKKEYLELDGRPVLVLSMLPFLELSPPLPLVITVPEADLEAVRELLDRHLKRSSLRLTAGGECRQESVRLGLEELAAQDPRYVLIHDGARPWVSGELIARVLEATRRLDACIPVLEASEAPKIVDPASGRIVQDLDRSRLFFAQTPQGFLFHRILEAHRRAQAEGLSCVDDAEVYARYCGPVSTVPGDPRNRKITYPEDLER